MNYLGVWGWGAYFGSTVFLVDFIQSNTSVWKGLKVEFIICEWSSTSFYESIKITFWQFMHMTPPVCLWKENVNEPTETNAGKTFNYSK